MPDFTYIEFNADLAWVSQAGSPEAGFQESPLDSPIRGCGPEPANFFPIKIKRVTRRACFSHAAGS